MIVDNCLNVTGDSSKLFEAIGRASKKFQPLPKNKPGQYGNQKFDYAPYHTIRKCILSHLHEEGVTFIQPIHSEGESCAVTLIVSGHGSIIQTTLKFEMNPKPQDFGKESTYFRRYQLQSFFCLEGDKDADDLEDPVVESQPVVSEKSVAKDAVPATSNEPVKEVSKVAPKDKPAEKTKETKSVNQVLVDAMKQLTWEMKDMNAFCLEFPDKFPNFVSATKLSDVGKATLLALLMEHKQIAPF